MKERTRSQGRPEKIQRPSDTDDPAQSRRERFFSEKNQRKPILVFDRDSETAGERPVRKDRPPREKSPEGRTSSRSRKPAEKRSTSRERTSGRGPAKERPYGRGPAKERPDGREPAKERPDGRGSAKERPYGRGPAKERPDGRGPTKERPDGRGPAKERPYSRGPAKERPYGGRSGERPYGRTERKTEDRDKAPEREFRDKKTGFRKKAAISGGPAEQPFEDKKKDFRSGKKDSGPEPAKPFRQKKTFDKSYTNRGDQRIPVRSKEKELPGKRIKTSEELIRLNKFIANAGICSRREADELIQAGAIRVNGKIITQLGFKISRNDKVQYGEETLRPEPVVYVLLNKPKGFITTVEDPSDRDTVMALVRHATDARIYPVGRLDRNTTGLLLLTNDGELAKKLTHPRHRIEKLYHAVLDKNLTRNDMETIANGMELEDGFIRVDEISYVEGAESKKEIGIRLHSGRNRIVRRIFEALGYRVTKLDRVIFAGLTKKDLPRGKWRFLRKEEVSHLKMLK